MLVVIVASWCWTITLSVLYFHYSGKFISYLQEHDAEIWGRRGVDRGMWLGRVFYWVYAKARPGPPDEEMERVTRILRVLVPACVMSIAATMVFTSFLEFF